MRYLIREVCFIGMCTAFSYFVHKILMLKPAANGCGTHVSFRTGQCQPRIHFMNQKYKYSYWQEPGYLDVHVKASIFLLISCIVLPFILRRNHTCPLRHVYVAKVILSGILWRLSRCVVRRYWPPPPPPNVRYVICDFLYFLVSTWLWPTQLEAETCNCFQWFSQI
jgi:hypothetical protein